MRSSGTILTCFCGCLTLLASGVCLQAAEETTSNPYQTIIERNAFGLKPAPPPPSNEPPPPPPAPLAKVTLTGIVNILGPARALLEITEQQAGKAATSVKPILRQGEREGSVEVLSIDIANNMVRIRNGTVETNLTFETPKSSPSPAPGAPPAMAAAFPTPIPPPSVTPASMPTIISRNTSNDRSGISVMGGNPSPMASAAPVMPTSFPRLNSGSFGMPTLPTASLANNSGLNMSLPSRTIRTDASQGKATQPPVIDDAAQYLMMRASEQHANQQNIPHPPTPPIPGLEE